jgi:GNAT superfamily N-acetyltransferase
VIRSMSSRRLVVLLGSLSAMASASVFARSRCAMHPETYHMRGAREPKHSDKYVIVDATTMHRANSLHEGEASDLALRIADVVNWAYRGGKRDSSASRAWTTEQHLLSGIRTTPAAVESMIRNACQQGPKERALFLAQLAGTDSADPDSNVVGTVHVERCGGDSNEAEIGLLSVDPSLQGSGIGGTLLRAAERHALSAMGCRKAVLWVISSRADLRAWYEGSCGYTATGETAPFPTGANVGALRPGVALEFVRLVKALDKEPQP